MLIQNKKNMLGILAYIFLYGMPVGAEDFPLANREVFQAGAIAGTVAGTIFLHDLANKSLYETVPLEGEARKSERKESLLQFAPQTLPIALVSSAVVATAMRVQWLVGSPLDVTDLAKPLAARATISLCVIPMMAGYYSYYCGKEGPTTHKDPWDRAFVTYQSISRLMTVPFVASLAHWAVTERTS